jgi:hypothetical protein
MDGAKTVSQFWGSGEGKTEEKQPENPAQNFCHNTLWQIPNAARPEFAVCPFRA